MNRAACVDIRFVVSVVLDPRYTRPKRVVELTASQRERTATRAEIRTVIAQSLLLITCSLHLDLSSFIH